MKSYFDQKITHKALSFKLNDSARLFDLVLESDEADDLKKKFKLKNVCAQLGEHLVNRLEDTLAILNMSKREFLEIAIIEALDKADFIMRDVGIPEYLEQISSPNSVQSGFKICDIVEEGGEKFLKLEFFDNRSFEVTLKDGATLESLQDKMGSTLSVEVEDDQKHLEPDDVLEWDGLSLKVAKKGA